jgi:leucyl-tRNA synthetase
MPYRPAPIESKWQARWEKEKTFAAREGGPKPKLYVLDMFPYPSGAGLHVGHPEGYTATDIVCRYKRMRGFNVLHPMGWDAFGLPAENYAIKTGTHPAATTRENVENFRRQIKSFGFSYDWDREVDTTDPGYYRWTQWIFLQLYKKGLAYESLAPINWCESCKTGLANEEVKEGVCDRCGGPIVKKNIRQWLLRITAYADRLLEDLDEVEWPPSTKEMQKNWIGRSEGAEVDFKVAEGAGAGTKITVFTTRPDTLFGATYMVLAPEHPLVEKLTAPGQKAAVDAYRREASLKSDLARTDLALEKTGVFTGGHAINPVTGKKIPVWISDYVLLTYGTGAIMAVPGHDQRDWEFARKFKLPIVEVVKGGDISKEAYVGDGVLVNSPLIDGLPVPEAKRKITAWLAEKGLGKPAVNFKLRDWVFSRQRYWGEPIPIRHVQEANGTWKPQPLDESELPLLLPDVKSYEPTGTGESPLAAIKSWVEHKDPKTGRPARYETNTMPQWAGSCWYYLRFMDPRNEQRAWDPAREKYWSPVDLYVGGSEHAVLHLLYSRFWHKVLFDLGHVSTKEPFRKLVHQGLILGEDGQKMSKSLGNVVNPDGVIDEYGADTFRLFEMFLGPIEASKPWNTKQILGVHRFLHRAWTVVLDDADQLRRDLSDVEPAGDLRRALHRAIAVVTADMEGMRFNTAISRLMELTTALQEAARQGPLPRAALETMVLLLSPLAPHLAEELWEKLGHRDSLAYQPWPEHDPAALVEETVEVAVQINGKVRDRIQVPPSITSDEIQAQALARDKVRDGVAGKQVVKAIYVPGKLLSLVVK